MRAANAAAGAAVLLLAGCGGSSTTATTTNHVRLTAQERHGRALFVRTCGTCHTLAEAGTHGTTGPDLDVHPWRAVYISETIADGPGLMPAGLLGSADANAVAAYLEAVTKR